MCQVLCRKLRGFWSEENGVLSYEWVVLATLLTIGIVSGVAAARDAISDELGDVAQAMLALDGSFTIDFPLEITLDGVSTGGASDSAYYDFWAYIDCGRTTFAGQSVVVDGAN